jgi:hypothetical protein
MKTPLALLLLTACGSDSSGKMADAAPQVPATINISGTASERSLSGTTPVAGLVVAAYSNTAPSTVVVMATTDANGMYTLAIPTMGKPVDGFVKATKSGYTDTYLFPPAPLTADFASASLNMLTPNEFGLLSGTLCAVTADPAKATVALEVVDASMQTVMGATVSSTPAASKECYDQGGFPNKSATATDTDGVAVMFNITAGAVMVSAAKSGATFKTHSINAVAGAFNTTLVTE